MNYITELQKFIVSHENWKELLESNPYNITVKEKDNLILFKNNQIKSDFSEPIVRESRGIILEKESWEVVCYPFQKFGNLGESYTANVDFSTARVQEKVDGSILKCYYYEGKWRVATNGTIDANECTLPNASIYGGDAPQTFGRLLFDIVYTKKYTSIWKAFICNEPTLDKNLTYMLEVVSPYNKVVISYDEPDIRHIGTRNNITGEELNIDIGVPKPKEYLFDSIEAVIEASKNLSHQEEGYVVVDSNWNRCKIKGVAYVNLHHLRGEGTPSEKRILELVRKNEGEEFLTYFEEFREPYERLEKLYEKFVENVYVDIDTVRKNVYNTRKEFALAVKDMTYPVFMFRANDDPTEKLWEDVEGFCREMKIESLLSYVKKEE